MFATNTPSSDGSFSWDEEKWRGGLELLSVGRMDLFEVDSNVQQFFNLTRICRYSRNSMYPMCELGIVSWQRV